jgi:formylglycine-generating enzyme required for sulfatase activity
MNSEFLKLSGVMLFMLVLALCGCKSKEPEKINNNIFKTFQDCPNCPDMVVIPAGGFEMGGKVFNTEKPIHHVTIGKSFAMGKTEVTRGQFSEFVNETGYNSGDQCSTFEGVNLYNRSGRSWRNPGYQQDDKYPATCLNWNDAKAYAEWLSRKTGKQYRLPSEAEWEYACRAGGQQEYCGSDEVNSVAWYGSGLQPGGNSSQTAHSVATKLANAWGLYDMSGNVSEWVEDVWHLNYDGAHTDGSVLQEDSNSRVVRGGSWYDFSVYLRSAVRGWGNTFSRTNFIGFRLAMTLP